ncbi:MAG TPA: N-acetylmuramoyl-L-alanine amidase [Alphaproteobacteria bacterium]|nr:N-acetylmuramoyl-L-alanine amidase [Alphaproteobacteria bacterium]
MKKIDVPYFDERNAKIDMIVIHSMAHDLRGALESFQRHEVSSHYMIDEKGKIYQFVNDEKRAWHAGKSYWQEKENLNHNSIGIELCSSSLGQEPYPDKQISALIRLCQRLKRKYHIKKNRILGHSDIAPTRKPDPGKAFPWSYLARHGLGVWYDLKNAQKVQLFDEKVLLSQIGYDISDLTAAKWAFIRHFVGKYVPHDTIQNLLEKPYPDSINIPQDEFLKVLKAVWAEFKK